MSNEMTEGIKQMEAIGFTTLRSKHNDVIRQFIKYDGAGCITDVVKYFYTKENGLEVYSNNLTNLFGNRLDIDLINAIQLNYDELNVYFKMSKGIKKMKELGFIDETNKHEGVVRAFRKYDDKGFITDAINYFYSRKTGVTVFANNVKHATGSRLDKDMLNAIQLNYDELDKHFKYSNTRLPDFDEVVDAFTKAFDSLTKESE